MGYASSNQVSYNQETQQPSNQPQKSQYVIEQKLIDEITKATGIAFKPTDTQLNDLGRRIKNLNIEVIYEILLNKIYCYENYDDQNDIKSLVKSLYVIGFLIKTNPDMNNYFSENISLFHSIKDHFTLNKKVIESCIPILKILDPDFTQSEPQKSDNLDNNISNDVVCSKSSADIFGLGFGNSDQASEESNNSTTNVKSKFNFIKGGNNTIATTNPKVESNSKTKREAVPVDDLFGVNSEIVSKVAAVEEDIFVSSTKQLTNQFSNLFEDTNKSAPVDLDFTKINQESNIDSIFTNKEKTERERKLNDILNQLGGSEQQTSTSLALPVGLGIINQESAQIDENHPFVQSQINTQLNYLISIYGSQNKDSLLDYAKKTVLSNPLLKEQMSTLGSFSSKPVEKIVLVKSNPQFDSKKAFGEEEKPKDSFAFVSEMLKKK